MKSSRVAWMLGGLLATCAHGFAQTTTLEGVTSQGIPGVLEQEARALTPDARFLVMSVRSPNLIVGDTNSTWDIYVRDRQNGAIERISIGTGGAQGNGPARDADISDDGRFVAFASDASNLHPGDANGMSDIFLRDRQLGTTTLVSRTSGGTVGSSWSLNPAISADGRWVAFLSRANDLVANDTNVSDDVFVFDAQTSSIERVSVSSAGVEANQLSFNLDISGDGRFVVFDSQAYNLVPGDQLGGHLDIFLRDRLAGTTVRLSEAAGGVTANGSSMRPTISANGEFVAFESFASNLVAGDTATPDVFLVELSTGALTLESRATDGTPGSGQFAELSADGRYITFTTLAGSVYAASDVNNALDVYLRDVQSSTTTHISIDSAGAQGWSPVLAVTCVAADGLSVAFTTANAYAIGDFNLRDDAFVRNLDVVVAPIATYCAPKTNSLGCNPLIAAVGTPRASGFDSFFLTAAGEVGNKSGIFFWGTSAASIPFGGGTLCVKPPTKRTPPQLSGGSGSSCDGVYSFHFTQAYMAQQGVQAGATLYGQFWGRDPGFAPPNNISLTNAATWTVVP
ncbi:MAG: PD40 domain-containing protein [Planctomycetes bacterium]|nr:PD40 domain-containing protein [Planctomycetota bacterium]